MKPVGGHRDDDLPAAKQEPVAERRRRDRLSEDDRKHQPDDADDRRLTRCRPGRRRYM